MSWDLDQIYHDLQTRGTASRIGGFYIVGSTDQLVNDQSATGKAYQGHLALGPARGDGHIVWTGLCSYGPGSCPQRQQSLVYQGASAPQACAAANEKVLSKLKRGYESTYGYPHLLDARAIIRELEDTLGEELPRIRAAAPSALEQLLGSQG